MYFKMNELKLSRREAIELLLESIFKDQDEKNMREALNQVSDEILRVYVSSMSEQKIKIISELESKIRNNT